MSKKLRALLINPPIRNYADLGKPPLLPIALPLGISYIAKSCEEKNIECNVYDFSFYTENEAFDVIVKENFDIFGVTCLTEQRMSALNLATRVKARFPNRKIVFGGAHATLMYQQLLENYSFIDYIILSEGEISFPELCELHDPRTIPGLAYREKGKILYNSPKLIDDIDSIAFPSVMKIKSLNDKRMDRYFSSNRRLNEYPIIASRGCWGQCTFCTTTKIWCNRYRFRTGTNIYTEIKGVFEREKISFFDFSDDTANKRSIKEFCKLVIKDKDLDIHFKITSRVEFIDAELCVLLKEAGCTTIILGAESGSDKILRIVKKGIDKEGIYNAFRIAKNFELGTFMLLMVGNVGETQETIDETRKMVDDLKPSITSPSRVMVFPGCELYEYCKERGFIDNNYWLEDKPSPHFTLENDISTINKWWSQIYETGQKWYKKCEEHSK